MQTSLFSSGPHSKGNYDQISGLHTNVQKPIIFGLQKEMHNMAHISDEVAAGTGFNLESNIIVTIIVNFGKDSTPGNGLRLNEKVVNSGMDCDIVKLVT